MPKIRLPEFDGNPNDYRNDSKVVARVKQLGLSIGFRYVLKIMYGHRHSFLNIFIIHNDKWNVTCTISSKPSHLLKHRHINVSMDSVEKLTRLLDTLDNFRDCIYLYALKRKLGEKTKRHWERSLFDAEILKYEDLRKFLTQ